MSTIDIPSHLNRNYFKTALENGLKETNVEILNLEFSMGSGVGENFLSSIYRVKVGYKTTKSQPKTVSLIVKNVTPVPLFANMKDMHNKETIMYFKILPEIENFPNGVIMAPKIYFSSVVEPKTMALEDMQGYGYNLANRQQGLDEEHCRIVFEKLGRFHALSLKYAGQHPEDMDDFDESSIAPGSVRSPAFEMVYVHNFRSTIKEVSNWPGYESIGQKMTKLEPHFADRLLENVEYVKDTFKVLNHGDMWINNLLFKYGNNKKLDDVIFIDYQGSVYASPGIDINYFLCTSTQPEVLAKRDYIVEKYYYKSFRQTLQEIGFKQIPTLDDIIREVRKKEFYGLASAIGLLPVLSMETSASKDNSFDKLTSGKSQSKFDNTCTSPRFQATMKILLKYADEAGILD